MEKEMRKLSRLFIIIYLVLIRQCNQSTGNFRGVRDVHVSLTLPPPIVQGDSVLLECGFNSTSAFKFNHLEWIHNGVKIAEYDESFELHKRVENNNNKFHINDETHVVLEVHVVNSSASENYTCRVQFNDQSSNNYIRKNATTLLTIQVPVKDVTILDQNNQPTAHVIDLIAGQAYTFHCVVPNLNPAASIEWTLGKEILKHKTSSVKESNGLSTTTSTLLLTVASENHKEVLSCKASNIEGRPGNSVNVTLDIKVDASSHVLEMIAVITLALTVLKCVKSRNTYKRYKQYKAIP